MAAGQAEEDGGMEGGGEGWEEARSLPCLLGLPSIVPKVPLASPPCCILEVTGGKAAQAHRDV